MNCPSCQDRANKKNFAFGHPQCSQHRPCTGESLWEPLKCRYCSICLNRLASMNVSQVKQFLSNYRLMLSEVRNKLKRDFPNRNWEYDTIFPYYFQSYIHLDPFRPDSTQCNLAQSQNNVFNTVGQSQPSGSSQGFRHNDIQPPVNPPALSDYSVDNSFSPEDEAQESQDPFFGHN